MSFLRSGGLVLTTALLACAAAPGAAIADSILHVFEHNVWLANPDGTGRYQVTTDGTAEDPYRSPSQADDGTIAVGKGQEILRMRQNGVVLNRIDPAPLRNSAGQPVDGPPVSVAISPDGTKIAYTLVGYSCPVAADCMARGVTAYTAADRLTPAANGGTPYRWQPSWVTNTRTLVFGGYLGQVNVHDVGQPSEAHWFDDSEMHAGDTDLNDGEVNRQGTKLALVRGYAGNEFGNKPHILTYTVNGNIHSGPTPANPTAQCLTGQEDGFHSPTWAPDGVRLAWGMPKGIEVHADATSCSAPIALVLPGASQPDWGPANVAPEPRPSGGGGGGGGGAGTGSGVTAKRAALSVPRNASIRRVVSSGLRFTVRCRTACRVKGRLRVTAAVARKLGLGRSRTDGSVSRRATRAGTLRLTVKPSRKVARRLKRLRRVTVTVEVTVTGSGTPQKLRKTVSLRRG